MNRLLLRGCAPEPLSHYLKALGVLRLLAEQRDAEARGGWEAEGFFLEAALTAEDVEHFFLDEYCPTPIIAPWNGGSGFAPKDNHDGIDAIQKSDSPRFAAYRQAVDIGHAERLRLGVTDKAEANKEALIRACRSQLPDEAVVWMDAAIVLSTDGPSYPPLLGTGGNDGRLDFSNNFMQRVTEVLDPAEEHSPAWLGNALWGEPQHDLPKASVGQFFPSAAGGANGTSGFEADGRVNPWDFVLMMEGALLFAAASTRRLASERGVASCPFSVFTVGAGYGSAAAADTRLSRSELWLPVWEGAASLRELRVLFSEGRAQLRHRPARSGVDFARAVSSLGVDRGLREFTRYAFLERNGQAFLAVPLGHYPVSRRPAVECLDELDAWLENLRGKSASDTAPGSVRRAVQNLDAAILSLCRRGGGPSALLDVLIEAGRCERALRTSVRWARGAFVGPVPPLSSAWLRQAAEDSAEFRLALSLATLRQPLLRTHLEPVAITRDRRIWFEDPPSTEVVWAKGPLVRNLDAILRRRMLRAVQEGEPFRLASRVTANLADVAAFIEGRVNEGRLADLIWALALLDGSEEVSPPPLATPPEERPAAPYALLKLCFAGGPVFAQSVPVNPEIHHRAAGGNGAQAAAAAVRRLRGSGLVPCLHGPIQVPPREAMRTAAALLFPISRSGVARLASSLHIKNSDPTPTEHDSKEVSYP